MNPLCSNTECNGIKIGYSCNCGENKNIWFTTQKPNKYTEYITIEDNVFIPESQYPLGYLIERDCSIQEYSDYAQDNEILYDNYTDMFIECNQHHYEFLFSTYCIPCSEFPEKTYYNSDDEHSEDCFYDINSDGWHCDCGRAKYIFEEEDFDPLNHSIKKTYIEGVLMNDN